MINRVYTVSEHLYFRDIVEIQTNISDKGLPIFEIYGLVSRSVEESKKRVAISLENCGFQFPLKNISVNIAPASISKSGTHYDLPIAVSILKEKIKIPHEKSIFIGEISFDGEVRHVENIFYLVISAIEQGFKHIYIPYSSKERVFGFDDVNIYPLKSLNDLSRIENILPLSLEKLSKESGEVMMPTYSRINGNFKGKKAISYSLIGNHSILIQGPPGIGKSMLIKSMPEIAPEMSEEDSISVSKIYSYAGIDREKEFFKIPFRFPHTLSSYSSIFGSFSSRILVGEVTLANKGILFLDEFPEFNRLVIEGLRSPLEDGRIQLSRSGIKTSLESNFLLAATMNPCKCGYYNHEKISCTCSPVEIKRYQSKISGPILDRIDIKLNLDGISNNYTNDDKLYPNLDFRYIKKFITEKKKLKESLLGTSNIGKNNYIDTYNIIVQKYFPNKIYSLLLNELKNTTISDRSKIKLINLIFTICIFNNRDQITLEDVLEGLSLTFKKSYL
jgi:magnesium chelatase family protein